MHIFLRPVHTEGLIDCSEEVPDRYRSFRRISSPFVAGSNHLTSPYATTSKNQRPAVAPVITASIQVEVVGPAKLPGSDDYGRLQQAPLFQILQKCGKRLIQRGAKCFLEKGPTLHRLKAVDSTCD